MPPCPVRPTNALRHRGLLRDGWEIVVVVVVVVVIVVVVAMMVMVVGSGQW